jgi:hypothetical protein
VFVHVSRCLIYKVHFPLKRRFFGSSEQLSQPIPDISVPSGHHRKD